MANRTAKIPAKIYLGAYPDMDERAANTALHHKVRSPLLGTSGFEDGSKSVSSLYNCFCYRIAARHEANGISIKFPSIFEFDVGT